QGNKTIFRLAEPDEYLPLGRRQRNRMPFRRLQHPAAAAQHPPHAVQGGGGRRRPNFLETARVYPRIRELGPRTALLPVIDFMRGADPLQVPFLVQAWNTMQPLPQAGC